MELGDDKFDAAESRYEQNRQPDDPSLDIVKQWKTMPGILLRSELDGPNPLALDDIERLGFVFISKQHRKLPDLHLRL